VLAETIKYTRWLGCNHCNVNYLWCKAANTRVCPSRIH